MKFKKIFLLQSILTQPTVIIQSCNAHVRNSFSDCHLCLLEKTCYKSFYVPMYCMYLCINVTIYQCALPIWKQTRNTNLQEGFCPRYFTKPRCLCSQIYPLKGNNRTALSLSLVSGYVHGELHAGCYLDSSLYVFFSLTAHYNLQLPLCPYILCFFH